MGYSENELLNKTFNEITYAEDVKVGVESLKGLLKGKITSQTFEKRYITKKGDIIWASVTPSLIKNIDNSKFILTQIVDITDRKRNQKALIESEQKFRMFFESVANTIFLIDGETGEILDVNKEACRLYGYSRDEFLRLKAMDLSTEPEKTEADIKLKNNTIVNLRYSKKKNGTIFPIEIHVNKFVLLERSINICTRYYQTITERGST